jgi:hypothetical protein
MDRTAGREFVLDIDLDYFCNALDNKRLDAAGAPAPAAGSGGAARLLEELALVLEANRVAPCLVAIALSPGFFPSDEWSTVIPRLRQIITAP